ncbi:XRE family transcriptional regulator [Methanosphaera sp. ISO3-F5]|uniref:ImmA/IrrE family metallo-endopeptidase n=1 Tax=Methanosphaera sp. ISO3-F5 TaxID=1452353 RepID=UPI002B258034|nr:XRE family transcriptional regulator [Methanosphaera sp. ISO3-F5]WQH64186.1 XRE family transcriptional regulator [Methanosphaera sp. ISO3-F5]
MSQSITVNPKWIIWSRKSLNYTLKSASKKLKITEYTLAQWESTGELTYKNMNKLAKLYDVSPLLFLNNTPPPEIEQYIKDYRTMNDKRILSSPEILKEIKHAKRKRMLLLDIADNLNKDLTFKYYQEKAPNKTTIISTIKESLDINAVKLNEYTIDDWIREFESLNILIFKFYNIKPEDINGYAFNNKKLPIIGINNRNSNKEKIFSLFNEYAHLLIGKDGISGDYNREKEEELCNSIASEILLPAKEIKKINISNINSVIRIISTRYNVGMENILYRLNKLNYLTDEELEEQLLKRVYNKETENKTEKEPEEKEEPKKDKPKKKRNYKQQRLKTMASKNLNQNGHLFVELLLEAYDEELINDLDLSNELGIPHTVIPYVINKLNGGRR